APVAGVDADVARWRRLEVGKLALILFAAGRADNAPERPRRQARRTQKLTRASVAGSGGAGLENRQLRCPTTTRAAIVDCGIPTDRRDTGIDQPLTVGLKKRLRKEFAIRSSLPVREQPTLTPRII